MNICLRLIYLILCSLSLYACSSQKKLTTIRIGVLPTMDAMPALISADKQLMKKNGIALKIVSFDSAVERDSAFHSGKIQIIACDLISSLLFHEKINSKILSLSIVDNSPHCRVAVLANPRLSKLATVTQDFFQVGLSKDTIIDIIFIYSLTCLGF